MRFFVVAALLIWVLPKVVTALGVTIALGGNAAMSSNFMDLCRVMNLGAGMMRSARINPHLFRNMPFDAIKDFQPVGMIADAPFVLLVNPSVPANTPKEYVALARSKPGAVTFGSSGIGSNTHLMGEYLGTLAGVKLKHVPYRGSAPSLQDMLAGAIPSMFDPITTNVPHINSGKVRLLAVSSEKRIDMYPNAPTFAEQGFPQLTTSTWVGVSGPKGMAPDVVARLYEELQKAYKAPEVVERFKEVVLIPEDKPMSPVEYAKFIADFAAEVREVEINPLAVFAEGKGCAALDCVIVPGEAR